MTMPDGTHFRLVGGPKGVGSDSSQAQPAPRLEEHTQVDIHYSCIIMTHHTTTSRTPGGQARNVENHDKYNNIPPHLKPAGN